MKNKKMFRSLYICLAIILTISRVCAVDYKIYQKYCAGYCKQAFTSLCKPWHIYIYKPIQKHPLLLCGGVMAASISIYAFTKIFQKTSTSDHTTNLTISSADKIESKKKNSVIIANNDNLITDNNKIIYEFSKKRREKYDSENNYTPFSRLDLSDRARSIVTLVNTLDEKIIEIEEYLKKNIINEPLWNLPDLIECLIKTYKSKYVDNNIMPDYKLVEKYIPTSNTPGYFYTCLSYFVNNIKISIKDIQTTTQQIKDLVLDDASLMNNLFTCFKTTICTHYTDTWIREFAIKINDKKNNIDAIKVLLIFFNNNEYQSSQLWHCKIKYVYKHDNKDYLTHFINNAYNSELNAFFTKLSAAKSLNDFFNISAPNADRYADMFIQYVPQLQKCREIALKITRSLYKKKINSTINM